jgi:hypothetical protein
MVRPSVLIDHRLGGFVRQVDDLQPPVTEGNSPLCEDAVSVGTARRKRFGHASNGRSVGECSIEADLSGNSTHIRL